jgi:signal transduction histidine kinase
VLGKRVIEGLPVSFARADGQTFNLLMSAGPLRGHRGKILGCVVTLTDVTRLKRVEEDLQSAVRARDEFLSIASHELRTPLTALMLQLQSLQHIATRAFGEGLEERVSHKLGMAVRQAGQLTKLIDGLLDVSRIVSGRLAQVHEEIELTGFAREVVERCRAEAERAGCLLEFTGNGKVVGSWDPMQLEQVLTNLVGNAIKYGPAKPIGVVVEEAGSFARILVRDQGIGIAEADTKRIFERFERAVSPQHYGGLGLGLFIASRIVQAYGGTIDVASKPGEGSQFTVNLPRRCA